jgi:uroporphyrinogen decarboxylase
MTTRENATARGALRPRELVLEALEYRQAELVPYQIDLTEGFVRNLKRKTGCEDAEAYLGNHLSKAKYKKNRKLSDGREIDLFGVTWARDPGGGDVGIIVDHPMKEPGFSGYALPEVQEEFARAQVETLQRDSRGTFRMFLLTMNFFERAWSLRGMENLLADMILNPKFVEELFDRILAHHLRLLAVVLDSEFEAVYIGDDWGQQKGLIMGPPMWRTYIKPGMKRMFDLIKSRKKYVCLHSCGDLREIFPELVDMGLDIYNTIQPEIYDLKTLKREFGRHVTFYGGISTQQLLPHASPAEVKDLTREVRKIMGRDGGYILAPTHAVTGDIPVENVLAMVEVARERNG